MIWLLACSSPAPAPAAPAVAPGPAAAVAPGPPHAPAADRWTEVVALAAAPETCVPAPQPLADALAADPRDPEEIRVQLGAWHAAQRDVFVKFADPGPVAGTAAVLAWSDWIRDGELPAWVHLLASLDRCGNAETAGVAATYADRLCAQRGAAFAKPALALGWAPLGALAAREAVAQVAAVESLSAGGGRSAEQVEDLKRYLEAWILDGGAGPLPPVERRPLAAMTRAAMDRTWSPLVEKRASAEACIAKAP